MLIDISYTKRVTLEPISSCVGDSAAATQPINQLYHSLLLENIEQQIKTADMDLVLYQQQLTTQTTLRGSDKINLTFAADISQWETRHPINRSDGVSNELSLATF